MNFRFPFPQPYAITQGYAENANNYYGGHHGALDIVPEDQNNNVYPASIFPIADGSEISIQDTSTSLGKGVRERIDITNDTTLRTYLKSQGVDTGSGSAWLDVLYWHLLDVTDKDGILESGTSLGHCGNTGNVYHDGQPVPDNLKGVPPYPGLHLHLETSIWDGQTYLNKNLDYQGRFDPNIIFNYRGENMRLVKQNGVVYLEAGLSQKVVTGIADPEVLSALFGDEPIVDGSVSVPESQTLSKGIIINKK